MRATEPTQLGEFTILEKIGQGAMDAVYKDIADGKFTDQFNQIDATAFAGG